MTDRPPPQPPVPRLEAFRPSDERIGSRPPQRSGPHQSSPRRQPRLEQQRQSRPRGGWLHWLAIALGGLGLLAAGAVALATVFLPVGLIRDQLVREVKARTGRDLVIAGATSLSIWPSLAVSMETVSLSQPAGMTGPPLLKARRVSANADVMALLQRRIVVERVILADPVIELLVDDKGRRNWDFAALASEYPHVQLAQAKLPPKSSGAIRDTLPPELDEFVRNSSQGGNQGSAQTTAASTSNVSIGDVFIENGTIRYNDARSGLSQEVKAINARVSARALTSPAEVKGSLAWRGDKVEFDARLTSPKLMLEQRPTRLNIQLSSARGSGRYDGTVNPAQGFLAQGAGLDGTLKVDSGSLRGLAIWLGAPLPDNGGLGAVSLKTDVRTGPTSVSLSNTELRLDDSTANGTVSVEIVGGRPYVKANLKVNSLDLNRYLGGPGATNSDAGSAAQPAGSASIEDLLRQSEAPRAGRSASPRDVAPPRGPQVKGSVQRSGWSEDPINLAALGLLDGEARVSLGGLLYKDVKIGASQLSLALKSRALRVTLDDMRLYDGQGRGTLTIDTTPAGPTVGAIFNLDGVSGLPLLKDAAGFEWIAGKAKLSLALGGQGANERAIVESLNGRADLAFTDGAIVGLNIQHLIRGLGQGKIGGLGQTPGDKTEFSEAGATYQIKAGIADSRDIRLVSPQLRVTGAGTVDLGHRQIDTTLRSKLVGGQPGLGGVDLSAIEIPIRVKGSWERPQIGPDMDAVMRDPNKAIEAVNAVAKQLGGKDIGQVLRGLMKRGAPGDQPVDPATGQPGSQAGGKGGNGGLQLLEQLLKK